jgi:hypothetical protein
MNRKSLGRVEIKDADKGIVDLVFATYNVVDKDGDVQIPGTFEDGAKSPVSAYGHGSTLDGRLPVGVATIDAKSNREAVAQAKFFMDTPDGVATFRTVKRLYEAGIGDWSYGYDPLEYDFGEWEGKSVRFLRKQRVKEISPVLEGAGLETRTLGVKSSRAGAPNVPVIGGWNGAMGAHDSAISLKSWRPNEVLNTMGIFPSIDDMRATHAYCDPGADPGMKSSYAFLHHEAPGGPANVRACMLGIAALNGAPGPRVPENAKRAVYDHLAGHIADAGRYVPDLRPEGSTLKFAERAAVVIATVADLVDNAAEVGASRSLKGKGGLTGANREILGWLDEELSALRSLMDTPDEMIAREVARAVRFAQGR